jgi:hypothetical protein
MRFVSKPGDAQTRGYGGGGGRDQFFEVVAAVSCAVAAFILSIDLLPGDQAVYFVVNAASPVVLQRRIGYRGVRGE